MLTVDYLQAPAQLHAISAGMLDPLWFTTMNASPDEKSECMKANGECTIMCFPPQTVCVVYFQSVVMTESAALVVLLRLAIQLVLLNAS